MTVYEIIRQKEQQLETLTREIAALREAARMLGMNLPADPKNAGVTEQNSPAQFP